MTYDEKEKSQYSGKPYEMYLFQTDTQVWRLTSADEVKNIESAEFEPTMIFHTEPSQGIELKSGTIKVGIPHDHEIAQLFYAYIPFSPLWLTIYRAHEGEPVSETVTYWTGKVAQARFTEYCELICVPEQETLKKKIPSVRHQPQCNLVLYSERCGVDKDLFKVEATLTSVSGVGLVAVAFGTKPNGWFKNGYIEFNMQRRLIIAHNGQSVTLLFPIVGLQVGDVVTSYAGCSRLLGGDCVGKFTNSANFLGFPWLPTKNPFDGSIAR